MTNRPTPAYVRIERHLRGLVADAAPGDRLPGDRELSTRFEVSRMTARQAVDVLVGEGRIYRVSGSGTYVAEHPVHRRVTRLLSFHEHMRRQGRRPTAVVLESGLRAGTPQENADLGQVGPFQIDSGQVGSGQVGSGQVGSGQDGSGRVGFLRRLLKGDDVPIGVEDALLSYACRTVLETDLAGGSLYEALARIGHDPARSKGTVTAESATADLARQLDVAVGAALIVQRQIVFDVTEQPIQLVVTRYVGDRFVFDIDQERHSYGDPREHAAEPTYDVSALRRP